MTMMVLLTNRSLGLAFLVAVLWLSGIVSAERGATKKATTAAAAQAECYADGTCATTTITSEGDVGTPDASDERETAEVATPPCIDEADECGIWADSGECDKNPDYMLHSCKVSCLVCIDPSLNLLLGEDLGVAQDLDTGGANEEAIAQKIVQSRQYMHNVVYKDPGHKGVKRICRAQESGCSLWAALGECENNAVYMNLHCAPMCQTCNLLDMSVRCPLDPESKSIWAPGDLNRMFERITTDPAYQKYQPNTLSRPDLLPYDTEANATYILGPWVVTLENFVEDAEAARLIELGDIEGYKRSADVGKLKFDGTHEEYVNEGRTSTNAWCVNDCMNDPLATAVRIRMAELTQIPENNTEYLQLLKYEVGQKYQTHHDYIEYEKDRPDGVRILTVFLYLNDVEAGGGTNFPKLNLTVQPKTGRVLLWPSVLDEAPHDKDFRTEHQALPVEKGLKYGANAWMHQRDFKLAYATNCL